jgi:16S rRNA (guanine527-N7)-methyltransferase
VVADPDQAEGGLLAGAGVGAEATVEPEPAAAEVVFGPQVAVARAYVSWLVGAGVQRGLIGPREPARIWSRHVLNCAVVAPLLPHAARVVDVGSGAGLPGIPLLLARPDLGVVLVEPMERRCVFLVEVLDALGLVNCRVVRGRAEDVVRELSGADVVTSRAVAPLAKLAAWSAPLARVGGEMLALKGSSAASELDRDRDVLRRLGLVDARIELVGGDLLDEAVTVVRATVQPPTRGPGSKSRRGR